MRRCEEKEEIKEIKEQKLNKHKRGIATLFAAFEAVAFWRGSWMLMDEFG